MHRLQENTIEEHARLMRAKHAEHFMTEKVRQASLQVVVFVERRRILQNIDDAQCGRLIEGRDNVVVVGSVNSDTA